MPRPPLAADTFGDPFDLDRLPLARAAAGYAVQRLDTDTLLDRATGCFLPVRSPDLQGLFDSFDEARTAAGAWVMKNCPPPQDHRLAIVPATFDGLMKRHILIYGVLCGQP
ncbi:MAG: hypothetical protein H6R15_2416 [Proteobacteria bacterium]|nr:hypothetical protein [Pseudomonadota bacterium]